MTSNNANLSEEVARRTIPIRLDAQTERPADRHPSVFKYPYIDQWASEHRNQRIWSVLVMGQARVQAGIPPGRRSLGSFESWASVIGGILDVTGVDGFLGNIDEFRAEFSQEQHQWAEFLATWHAEQGDRPLRVKEILEVYRPGDDFLNISAMTTRGEETAMGRRLKAKRNAVYGRLRLEHAGTEQGGQPVAGRPGQPSRRRMNFENIENLFADRGPTSDRHAVNVENFENLKSSSRNQHHEG